MTPPRHAHPAAPTRRAFVTTALSAAALLAACGGGSAPQPPAAAPAITEFSADRASYFIGDSAQIRVRFAGDSARIEPDIGAVANGAVVTLPRLAQTRRLRLVVDAAGKPSASRELTLPVSFRERWLAFDTPPITYHATVATAEGAALVIGGSRLQGVLSSAIDRVDPATGTLQRIGEMASGRSNHSAVRLPTGQVLVFGGAASLNEAPFAELIDERSGASSRAGTLQQGRIRHAAVLLADGRVLAVGGYNRNSVELWDPATRSWRLVSARMAHAREYPTATLLADGRVLIGGGSTDRAQYVFAELFDPRSESFTAVPAEGVEPRLFHVAARQADGAVLIAGGEPVFGNDEGAPLSSVWRYVPEPNGPGRFSAAPALTTPRTLAQAVMTPDDEWLLFGGQSARTGPTDSTVSWRSSGQRALPPLPSMRAFHTATRLSDGRVLVLGGDDLYGRYATRAAVFE